MSLIAYVVLALITGATCGTCLGFLANAEANQVSERRRWMAVVWATAVIAVCAVVIRFVGDLSTEAVATKAIAVVAFFAAFALAISRWKLTP